RHRGPRRPIANAEKSALQTKPALTSWRGLPPIFFPQSCHKGKAAMGAVGIVHAAEIRVLGLSAIEDYHAHLMRLDRASLFPGDGRSVDAHCLELVASGAILIGAYVKGVMRAAAEIVPDRT